MDILRFDTTETVGKFKILNATNGGPWCKRHIKDQPRSNFNEYKAARIPFSRNHDSGVCAIYGGPYSHDIANIFPRFEADVNDPASYDFACTDESILICRDAGTETFFRLGQTIEHQIKKHHIYPPADFSKWAEICEHVIRHYNEGWANGLRLGIQYWEIWNEPDLYADCPDHPSPTWGGTRAQFFDFYEVVAKHLKAKFPHLKIGGPAVCGNMAWAEEFLREMQKRNVPIDFFSWHVYGASPEKIAQKARIAKELLLKYGYENAESILNEWNYVRGWDAENFPYSIMAIHGLKNASFILSVMALSQAAPLDMLMYYDTRPGVLCGVFDFYTCKPQKAYYPLYWFGNYFYGKCAEIRCKEKIENVYSLCRVGTDGKVVAIITHYSDDDQTEDAELCVDFGRDAEYEIYSLDHDHNGELTRITKDLTLRMSVHSCVLIKEK